MSYPTITCPTGCDSYVPAINMDECAPAVDISEVNKIYMTKEGEGLTDWTDLSEWTGRIDNDGTDDDDIREFWVSGEQAEPERNVTEIDNDREVSSPSSFEVNAEIFDVHTDTYDAMRQLECNFRVTFWYAAGDYLYGGTDGITADIVVHYEITKGQKEINKIVMKLKWDAEHHPERITNPML